MACGTGKLKMKIAPGPRRPTVFVSSGGSKMLKTKKAEPKIEVRQKGGTSRLTQLRRELPYFIMMLLPTVFFLLFKYWPMFGIAIAFQNYRIGDPFISLSSRWVGLKWFKQFVSNAYFTRYVRNTLALSLLNMFISFPISILFALLLNEVRVRWMRKFVSNVSLLPHFISTVVIVGVMTNFFSIDHGVANLIIEKLGGERIDFMGSADWFRTMYTGSGIWQSTGFNAVVFTAAIAGIDPNLYEAAALDGSTRLKNIIHITLPCILPTVIIMFLLKIGSLMSVGYEKIILMYSPLTYETADVLSTYSYRVGITEQKYSLSSAISLMNSICNITLLLLANRITRKVSETSLW